MPDKNVKPATDRCSQKSRAAQNGTFPPLAQSLWHRLQRSSLYTRIMPPISMEKGWDTFIVFSPIFRRFSNFGSITIRLDAVKQGTYHGSLATLVRLEIVHGEEYRLRQTAFKIVLETSRAVESSSPASIVAFGPGRLTRPRETDRFNAPPAGTIPHIEVRQQKDYLMMEIEDYTRPRGFPLSAHLGLVIVHDTPAQLTVIPSTRRKSRAAVLRKSRIYPLDVDLTTAFNDVRTCARDGGQACSATCADFGPEHMTPALWEEMLKDNRRWGFEPEEPNLVGCLSRRPG